MFVFFFLSYFDIEVRFYPVRMERKPTKHGSGPQPARTLAMDFSREIITNVFATHEAFYGGATRRGAVYKPTILQARIYRERPVRADLLGVAKIM